MLEEFPISSCEDKLRKSQVEFMLMTDSNEKLTELLKHNPDTGLYHRNVLLQKMGRMIRGNPDRPFTYGIIRLDRHYQRIRHSRDRQKILLYVTAQRIKDIVGEEHLFQSDRNDEFLVIVPDMATEEEIVPYFEVLMDKISEPHNNPASDLSFGCHMGVARYPFHATTVEELLDNAEIALGIYEQRHDHGFIYTHELGQVHGRRRTLETVFSLAVGQGLLGFHVVYQPIVDQNKKLISCEALMRWDAPEHGAIPPLTFIPIAEETGHINTLGQWILYNSVLQVKNWRKAHDTDISVSVNVSAIQFENPHYLENVIGILEALEMDGECLHIEVTESTLMSDPDLVVEKLEQLRALGIRIMLDDFGTGYSSLSALHNLPVDILKIAKEFIDEITKGDKNLDMVRAIQQMANSFGLLTLAEGVEQQEQFDLITREGCHLIQGYITSPPVAATEFSERFLK